MKWQDTGVIVHKHRYAETKSIVTIFTKDNGKYKGVINVSKSNRGLLEQGNIVQASWNARLEEHLGCWKIEELYSPIPYIVNCSLSLQLVSAACALLEQNLPERDKASDLYSVFINLLKSFSLKSIQISLQYYCLFEIALLEYCGFRLDMSKCVVTGSQDDLAYLSPKSGCAVSVQKGKPYADKLFKLPGFLVTQTISEKSITSLQEVMNSIRISSYFLNRYVFVPHDIQVPKVRDRLINSIIKKISDNDENFT